MDTLTLTTRILRIEEGYREDVYLCSEGYPTVGIGLRVGYKGQSLNEFRDFPTVPLSVSELWLSEALRGLVLDFINHPELGYWVELDPVRQAVMLSMAYQMGLNGLLRFRKTLEYIKDGKYLCAGKEMLDSRWALQTPLRAERHSEMMIDGVLLDYYRGD